MLKGHLVGNISNDPESRYSANGTPVLTFNIASNYSERNTNGEWEKRVEFVRATVFGNRADALSSILKKGQRIYVDGHVKARPWIDREGNPRAGLEIVAEDVEFASARSDGDGAPRSRPDYFDQPSGAPAGART